MRGNDLFEYAVIRVVPRVEREEFLNVGVILYCREQNFLGVKYTLNKERLQSFCGLLDCNEVEEHLRAFELICEGKPEGGPIAALDLPSRFRWLTATRSTVVQSSRVHPGFCESAAETLEKLHRQLVL
ncbi:MAG TPA: DUF3037 domain-containing protein [Flavisolibacter sp.]|nr:DUF3037 domain-containing protein [Flavisolibacter sp.]